MKKKIINILEIILPLIIVVSVYKIYGYYNNHKEYEKLNEEYKKIENNFSKEEGKSDSLYHGEEDSVKFVNNLNSSYKNVIARITINSINMDFPVVKGEDNSFYLNHNYKNEYNEFGSVFMDARNNINFTDKNTILYGHNVRSGHVFHDLNKFRDEKFAVANPHIIIDTLKERKIYEIFAIYEAGEYEDYRSPDYDDANWEKLLSRVREKNLLKKEIPSGEFEMLTLSTCSDIYDRFVIHAVKLEK